RLRRPARRARVARGDLRRARGFLVHPLPEKARLMARPPTDIRQRILGAARARFLAEGVDGASLREIARDAKTTIGMVSYYFPAKDDLFLAVVEEVYAVLLGDLE